METVCLIRSNRRVLSVSGFDLSEELRPAIVGRVMKIAVLGLLCIVVMFPLQLQAQWKFDMHVQISGNCSGWGSIAKKNAEAALNHYWNSLPAMIPTKAACESARATINGYTSKMDGCTARIICSPCTGRDIGGNVNPIGVNTRINPGDLSYLNNYQLGGVDKGMASFSSTPAEDIALWEEEFNRKTGTFAYFNGASSGLGYVATDDSDFDAAYVKEIQNISENGIVSVLPKGSLGRSAIRISPTGVFRGIDDSPLVEAGGNPNRDQVKRYTDNVASFAYGYINNPRDLSIELPKLFMTATKTDEFPGYDINAISNKLPGERTPEERQVLTDYNEFVEQMCKKIISTLEIEKHNLDDKKIYDMAILAEVSYDRNYDLLKETSYVLIDKNNQGEYKEIQSLLYAIEVCNEIGKDPNINFSISAFYDSEKNEYSLTFRGSDHWQDFLYNNLPQGVGMDSPQHILANTIANAINKLPQNVKINITGHSLGGGLGSLVGALTGRKTYTFNAAGIHYKTLESFGITSDIDFQKNISTYNFKGDPLTAVQDIHLHPSALGKKYEIAPSVSVKNEMIKAIDMVKRPEKKLVKQLMNPHEMKYMVKTWGFKYHDNEVKKHYDNIQYEVQKQLNSNNLYKKETINILVP